MVGGWVCAVHWWVGLLADFNALIGGWVGEWVGCALKGGLCIEGWAVH